MSYVTSGGPQVVRTYPANLAKDVDVKAVIEIEFNTDLDRDYIQENIQVSDGRGTPIPGTITYGSRRVTFTPTRPLNFMETIRVFVIGDDMSGRNIGMRNVLGARMRGNYSISFTTAYAPKLSAPVLVSPIYSTAIRTNPRFDWKPVTGADHYQIQVSRLNTMNPVVWPPKWDEFKVFDAVDDDKITVEDGTYYILRETIDPAITFDEGLYYWRMRAVAANGEFGEWTELHSFYIDKQEEGVVSEEDAIIPDIIEFDEMDDDVALEILGVFPEDAFSNVATNLKTVYVHVLGEFTQETFNGTFEIEGLPVDGDESDPTTVHGIVEGSVEVIPQGDGTTIIAFIIEPLEIEVS